MSALVLILSSRALGLNVGLVDFLILTFYDFLGYVSVMHKVRRLSRRKSVKVWKRGKRLNPKNRFNMRSLLMRGGYRL